MEKRKLFVAGLVLVAALGIAGVFLLTRYSRLIDVQNPVTGTSGTTTTTTTIITTNNIPIAAILPNQPANFSVDAVSTFVFPTTPIDTAAYDAKTLALANLPPPRIVKTIVSTTTVTAAGTIKTVTTTVMKTVSVQTGWPVKTAPYPITGALLPYNRIVAYYGNLYSTQMGVLGQYPETQVLAMLASTTAMWTAADPSTPAIPALDYIAITAQGSPGADGKYRLRMPPDQINKVLGMASQAHGIVFLDVQVGLSNVETEVPLLEPYLKLPQVELSLDPEFDMHNGERPGTVIGTMDASDINFAANYIAGLVRQYNLPPKILVVHRFTEDMVTNYRKITPLPEVQIVMDMDGFGFPAKKINTYQQIIIPEPVQFTGFKLFYKNDTLGPNGALMTPAQVLKLSPQPSYIQYQ